MAACNVGGITIHSFSGIGLGIESAEVLVGKIRKNRNASGRWQRVKVLVIDEGKDGPTMPDELMPTPVLMFTSQSLWSTVSSLTNLQRSPQS